MRKSLQYQILASVLAMSVIGLPANVQAADLKGDGSSGSYVVVNENNDYENVYGGEAISNRYSIGEATKNIVEIIGGRIENDVYGGHASSTIWNESKATGNIVKISGGRIGNNVYGGYATGSLYHSAEATGNKVEISGGTIINNVYGGYATGIDSGAIGNSVNISGGEIGAVYGGRSDNSNAKGNNVNISGGIVKSNVCGGYIQGNGSAAINNSITLSGTADVSDAGMYGGDTLFSIGNLDLITGNTLNINGWSGSTKSVQNFNTINFDNIKWKNKTTVLDITNNQTGAALAKTDINIKNISFQGGERLEAGERMTFISGDNLQIDKDKVSANDKFTAGVAVEGTGQAQVAADGNSVTYTLTSVKYLDQVDLVAENRAVAAAFVNQGTDLISDSMDTLSRDGKYGIKTFAAVHGNRSKYDVNSDIKINGWSSIVGVGNEKALENGDFSWGVFYENGSGNYRTYNEFNNEFFRGDGSLVYNGGGIAARYEQDNGVYTEGSLRAGMLKSEMSNALKDGAGNSYGYKSESSYYGAHLGVGKVITLDDNKDLDIYGKFFHTYTDGDSFTVAGDKFEFDSITSDRLRIGARLTTNKENKVSTYYGLAYEYEFNGDAQMRAQNMSTPEQSLQGSSYMAEVGMNYQPDEDSPWSFDLNMRGYAGEREGASFNVQATYTF